MANETYTLIQKTTLNAAAATITFSSIPQTFTDLVVKVSARHNSGANNWEYLQLTFNSSATSYSGKTIYGYSTFTGSENEPTAYVTFRYNGGGTIASSFGNAEVYVPNYTSTSTYKSLSVDASVEQNTANGLNQATAALWSNTNAITSVTLTAGGGSFAQYTSASLYGVAKQGVNPVAGPKAIGGDIITNDGTYWIHQFLNSGTFTPNQPLSCGYLVVAGGGGGGGQIGAGGGAGGLRSTVTATGGGGTLESALSVTAQSYAITVGAGGAGSLSETVKGSNGANSIFSTVTSVGGGGGTSNNAGTTGNSGGSGGGGDNGTGIGGAGTANQGYAGGGSTGNAAGGGGGAGAVGATTSTATGGAGGIGVAVAITGSSTYYAGGGGAAGYLASGGAGGNGGGGAGGNYNTVDGTSGTSNTGGGGGGNRDVGGTVANGGSGIVIIRYAI